MSGGGVGQPDGSPLVVNAVPEPPAARDFVLPLLHRLAIDLPAPKFPSKRVLTIVASPRIRCEPFPGDSGIGRRRRTHALPSGYRIACRITQIPPLLRRRWGYSFPALRHRSARGSDHRAAQGVFDRPTQTIGQFRVGVDLGRGSPLTHELTNRRIVIQFSRGRHGVGELGDE
jgi:hypothetical protein